MPDPVPKSRGTKVNRMLTPSRQSSREACLSALTKATLEQLQKRDFAWAKKIFLVPFNSASPYLHYEVYWEVIHENGFLRTGQEESSEEESFIRTPSAANNAPMRLGTQEDSQLKLLKVRFGEAWLVTGWGALPGSVKVKHEIRNPTRQEPVLALLTCAPQAHWKVLHHVSENYH